MSEDTLPTLRLGTSGTDLEQAAELLRAGRLVALPTETVYGLAVRADDPDAVTRLFAAKGRPSDNPLIVHVATVDDVLRVARELTPLATALLGRLAPGPLTVVLPARDDLPRAVTGGLDTVAVRIPDHPVMRDVLARCGVPLAAPSANRSGRPSPTRAQHVLDDLDGRIDAVVDGGATRVGVESTVVDARGNDWQVLREGGLGHEAIAAALRGTPHGAAASDEHHEEVGGRAGDTDASGSPGLRHRHYAPALPVHVASTGGGRDVAARMAAGGARVGLVMCRAASAGAAGAAGASRPDLPTGVELLAMPEDTVALAAGLFALLRAAEEAMLDALVVEAVPEEGVGRAVMDRLRRAAAASGGSVTG